MTEIIELPGWPAYRVYRVTRLVYRALYVARRVGCLGGTRRRPRSLGRRASATTWTTKRIGATSGFGVRYRNIHAADERIEIASIEPAYRTYLVGRPRAAALGLPGSHYGAAFPSAFVRRSHTRSPTPIRGAAPRGGDERRRESGRVDRRRRERNQQRRARRPCLWRPARTHRHEARVDVISGTSAGGVNGALLASRAPATPTGARARLWLDKGSLFTVFRASRFDPSPASLLRGDERFFEDLLIAFRNVRASGQLQPPDAVPYGSHAHSLRCCTGNRRRPTDDLGQVVADVTHRGRFHFRRS